MSYFPFFVNISELQGVIIGGGSVALEKVERLLTFQAKIVLVAKDIRPEIREIGKQYGNRITIFQKEYASQDLKDADYVIAATNLRELNQQIYRDAKAEGKLINVVDMPDLCDFIFPSVLQKGKLVVGVSTSGAGPQVAIRLRREFEKVVPEDIEDILDTLSSERIRVKDEIADPKERRKYLIELADQLLHWSSQ